MAEDDRTSRTSTPAANRAEMQGLGVGQKEMDAQRAREETRAFDSSEEERGAAAPEGAELGTGTPANVDVHDIGDDDKPMQDWGEETDEGLMHSANHTRRPIKTEAERGQGRKTRRATKDIISRRST